MADPSEAVSPHLSVLRCLDSHHGHQKQMLTAPWANLRNHRQHPSHEQATDLAFTEAEVLTASSREVGFVEVLKASSREAGFVEVLKASSKEADFVEAAAS